MTVTSMRTIIIITLCAIQAYTAEVTSSTWEVVNEENPVSYDLVTNGRSAVECAIHCRRSADCMLAAYYASSQTCFLRSSNAGSSGDPQGFATQTFSLRNAFGCEISDAGSSVNGSVSAWRTSMTWVEGNVTCNDDLLYNAFDTPRVRCEASAGRWMMEGSCMQRIWRNDTVALSENYFLPRTPMTGWSMCLTATTTSDTYRFQVNLKDGQGNQPLHISVRLQYGDWVKTGVLTSLVGDTYGPDSVFLAPPTHPFPFAQNQQFTMRITASDTNQFDVYVDGGLYGSRLSPLNVSSVTRVQFLDNIQVHYLDLWCV